MAKYEGFLKLVFHWRNHSGGQIPARGQSPRYFPSQKKSQPRNFVKLHNLT